MSKRCLLVLFLQLLPGEAGSVTAAARPFNGGWDPLWVGLSTFSHSCCHAHALMHDFPGLLRLRGGTEPPYRHAHPPVADDRKSVAEIRAALGIHPPFASDLRIAESRAIEAREGVLNGAELRGDIFERNNVRTDTGGLHSSSGSDRRGKRQGASSESEGPEPDLELMEPEDLLDEHGNLAQNPQPTDDKPISKPKWRDMCERFPEELEDLVGNGDDDEEDSEEATFSEELHKHLSAAAVASRVPLLEQARLEYGCMAATGVATSLFIRAVNKVRPVTPLMAAAAAGSVPSVEWLLAHGARADIR